MGLFTSKKNLCPICGSPTPKLFATKIEGEALCKECAGKIQLPQGAFDSMTMSDFQQYLVYYDENAALRSAFANEYCFDVDGWSEEIQIDLTKGLFRLSQKKESIVFEGKRIKSFYIAEDTRLLYEGDAAGLRCYPSEVPERLERIVPILDNYLMEKREYERMKRLEDMLDRDGDRPRRYIPEPRFDPPMPVDQFHVVLTLDDPYWPIFAGELDGPTFGAFEPELATYMNNYEKKAYALDTLAHNLMNLFAPNAPEKKMGFDQPAAECLQTASPAAAASTDVISEIQKYKTLLDAGVITEDEFTAKKKQLMGI